MTGRVVTHEVDRTWLPLRVTYLRDGEVLETHVITDAGVLTIGAHGDGVVCVMEFGDGYVKAVKS